MKKQKKKKVPGVKKSVNEIVGVPDASRWREMGIEGQVKRVRGAYKDLKKALEKTPGNDKLLDIESKLRYWVQTALVREKGRPAAEKFWMQVGGGVEGTESEMDQAGEKAPAGKKDQAEEPEDLRRDMKEDATTPDVGLSAADQKLYDEWLGKDVPKGSVGDRMRGALKRLKGAPKELLAKYILRREDKRFEREKAEQERKIEHEMGDMQAKFEQEFAEELDRKKIDPNDADAIKKLMEDQKVRDDFVQEFAANAPPAVEKASPPGFLKFMVQHMLESIFSWAGVEQKATQKQEEYANYNERYDDTKAKADNAQEDLKEHLSTPRPEVDPKDRTELARLKKKLEKMQAQEEKANKALDKAQSALNSAKDAMEKAKESKDAEAIAKAKEEFDKAKEELDAAKKGASDAKSATQDAQKPIGDLEKKVNNAEAARQKWDDTALDLRKKHTDLVLQMADLTDDLFKKGPALEEQRGQRERERRQKERGVEQGKAERGKALQEWEKKFGELSDDEYDEVTNFKPKSTSPSQQKAEFLQKASPEMRDRVKGMSNKEFQEFLAAVSAEEETPGKMASELVARWLRLSAEEDPQGEGEPQQKPGGSSEMSPAIQEFFDKFVDMLKNPDDEVLAQALESFADSQEGGGDEKESPQEEPPKEESDGAQKTALILAWSKISGAENYFFDNPEKREVRQFAKSKALSNLTQKEREEGAPPTMVDIHREQPGDQTVSTLSRYIVRTEEPVQGVPQGRQDLPRHPRLASELENAWSRLDGE